MPSTINERIKKYRLEKKLTQAELGKKLGLKCSTYSQMERQGGISVDMAHQIAAILEIDPNLIFFDEPEEKLDFSPVKPQLLQMKSPSDIDEILYGNHSETKETDDLTILTNTEKSIISIYRNLSKTKQKLIRNYIDIIRKSR